MLHWKMSQKALHFVQRGRILLRCGSALALSLPSLGVSSLDLGRLFTQAALFSCAMIPACAFFLRGHSGMVRRTRPGISRFRVRCFASPRNDERLVIPRRPGTVRG